MIQITRPIAAKRKWLRINGGRIRDPDSLAWRIPPLESQIASRTNPPPAVAIQAISAAHSIQRLLSTVPQLPAVKTVKRVTTERRLRFARVMRHVEGGAGLLTGVSPTLSSVGKGDVKALVFVSMTALAVCGCFDSHAARPFPQHARNPPRTPSRRTASEAHQARSTVSVEPASAGRGSPRGGGRLCPPEP